MGEELYTVLMKDKEQNSSDTFYSVSNQKYLMKSLEDYKFGKLTQHELIEVKDK